MTQAQDIVQQGFRELNIIAVGTQPNAAQATEGLQRLNNFVRSLYGTIMGEYLEDWLYPAPQRTAPVAANYPQLPYPQGLDGNLLSLPFNQTPGPGVTPYPPRNSRIVFAGKAGSSYTIYFPEAPDDGSRMGLIQGATGDDGIALVLDGNGRMIDAASTFSVTTPVAGMRWLYRADIGDWRPMASLLAADEMPFCPDMDEFMVSALAIRFAPGYAKTVSAETAAAYKRGLSAFRARYRQEGTTTYGSGQIPNSQQSFVSGRWWY
jgi:hypothetical protein